MNTSKQSSAFCFYFKLCCSNLHRVFDLESPDLMLYVVQVPDFLPGSICSAKPDMASIHFHQKNRLCVNTPRRLLKHTVARLAKPRTMSRTATLESDADVPFWISCNNSPDSSIATRIGMEGFGSFVGASKCIGTGPLTSKPVTKQKRQTGGKKRNVEKGENMLWRWLRKLGWKRTEIAFGAVWLRL